MSHTWRRFAACFAALAAAVAVTLAATELPAPMVTTYKNVKLTVTAVRVSKDGEDYVTGSLGDLGDQIKKKFGARRVTLIGQAEIDPKGEKGKAPADLGENLTVKVQWRAVLNDAAHFHVTVMLGGNNKRIDSDETVPMNGEGIATGTIDADVLVIVMSPKGEAGK